MSPTVPKHNGQDKEFFHQLVDEAFAVVRATGIPCNAHQLRVDLWLALRRVFARERRRQRLFLAAGKSLHRDKRLIARLAEAAYQAALGHALQRPFVAVELAIWERFHDVAKNYASPESGVRSSI